MNRSVALVSAGIAFISAIASVALLGFCMVASVGPCNNRGGFPWQILWPFFPLTVGYCACGFLALNRKTAYWPHVFIGVAVISFSVIIGEMPEAFIPLILAVPSLILIPIAANAKKQK